MEELRTRVLNRSYRPWPLLEIIVEKQPRSGKTRALLVPCVQDRVLQTAVARFLSRSFEEEFLECSFAYRPGRSVDRAIARIRMLHGMGYRYAVDADIHSFFDEVDHDRMLGKLARRDASKSVLWLLERWIRGEKWDGRRITGISKGIPQGSPISPLLANFFLEELDTALEKQGRRLVRYADDFMVLARTQEEARESLEATAGLLLSDRLELAQDKTRITSFEEGFRFLGAYFQGEGIWIPWKHDARRGRLLSMAPPLPARLRGPYLEPCEPKPDPALSRRLEQARQHNLAFLAALDRLEPRREKNTMAYLYLTEQGSILRKAGDRFLIEKDGEILLDLPYHKLETILLFGNVQVTTQAVAECLEKGIRLSFLSRRGQYRGALVAPQAGNVLLRLAQFQLHAEPNRAIGFARNVVEAKLLNGLQVLRRLAQREAAPTELNRHTEAMGCAVEGLSRAATALELDGMEGNGAREYFAGLMLFNKSALDWPGRKKHPSTDPLNALLSFGYTLLMYELTALLEALGLDPQVGFYHALDLGRPSLALDLLEAFRHPFVDRLVLACVNRETVKAEDFEHHGDSEGVFLIPEAQKRFLAAYEKWMLSPAGKDGRLERRRVLRAEAERFAGALREGTVFEPWREGLGEETTAVCDTSSVMTLPTIAGAST